jgi:anti-sigma factor RsiW
MATQCKDIEALLPTYLDGELAAHDQLSLEHHVADCPPCREQVRAERDHLDRMRRLLAPPPPPPGLDQRIRQMLDREDAQLIRARRRSGGAWLLPGSATVAAAAALALFAVTVAEDLRTRGDDQVAAPMTVREPTPERVRDIPVVAGRGASADVRALSRAAERHLRRPVTAPRLDQVAASMSGVASEWGGREAYMVVFDDVPDAHGGLNRVTVHMLDARFLDLRDSERYVVPATGTEIWVSTALGPTSVSYQDGHGTGYVFSSQDMAPADLVGLVIAFGAFSETR